MQPATTAVIAILLVFAPAAADAGAETPPPASLAGHILQMLSSAAVHAVGAVSSSKRFQFWSSTLSSSATAAGHHVDNIVDEIVVWNLKRRARHAYLSGVSAAFTRVYRFMKPHSNTSTEALSQFFYGRSPVTIIRQLYRDPAIKGRKKAVLALAVFVASTTALAAIAHVGRAVVHIAARFLASIVSAFLSPTVLLLSSFAVFVLLDAGSASPGSPAELPSS
ncbi:unnamed protein product (mitochondrion) [Plasmodiophora brassicae]|uniref:Uncharacterized protein n=1 Tax=Plasmodiophora brassicae TaxID=37360 RepID=A0A0G4IH97_PLABS|nr:hypothetical protein PBRA_000351 [Plasmodiophora brassicae]SPQ96912.1 unnamed protein product [Plasmodiophora brassicae]